MESAAIEQNISAPFLQIKYAKCTEKIPGMLVSVAGLLTSIWANCLLVITCLDDFHSYSYNTKNLRDSQTIIMSSQWTHMIVTLTVTAGLIIGLKENNRSLLTPWLVTKVIELIMLVIGIILIACGYATGGFTPIIMGILFIVVGSYILLCVWKTYKKMDTEEKQTSLEDINVDTSNEASINPPSYDSCN